MSLDHDDIDRLVTAYREDYSPDVEAGLQRLHARIGTVRQLRPRPRRQRLYRLSAVAAALLLCIVAAVYLLANPGRTTLNNATASIADYTLPDGTRVTLQEGSTLTYDHSYNESDRRVELMGQGYFEVQADAARPFYVSRGANRVRVTGTAFNVKAGSEMFEVEVSEGTVELHTTGSTVAIKAMEYATVVPGEPLVHAAAPHLNHHAWRTGTLKFDHTPVADVITYLNDNWGVVCDWENGAACDYEVSGSYTGSDVTAVLSDVAKLGGLSVRSVGQDGKHYELTGPCTL